MNNKPTKNPNFNPQDPLNLNKPHYIVTHKWRNLGNKTVRVLPAYLLDAISTTNWDYTFSLIISSSEEEAKWKLKITCAKIGGNSPIGTTYSEHGITLDVKVHKSKEEFNKYLETIKENLK